MFNELSCSVTKDLLPQYVEGLLSPESEKEVRRHLEHCKDCQQIYREMTDPEPVLVEAIPEVDYLKKVRRNRLRFLAGALAAALVLTTGAWFFFRDRAAKRAKAAEAAAQQEVEAAQQNAEEARLEAEAARRDAVNYDEASRTIVIFGKSGDVNVDIPLEYAEEAENLDAQYESFHLSISLPLLRNVYDETADAVVENYVNRTNQSLRFIRNYLKDNCEDQYPAERADKYVEITVLNDGKYDWKELDQRITLEIGKGYWDREELYVLAMLGGNYVQWKQLGYACYLGNCLNPWSEVLQIGTFDEEGIRSEPYGDAYFRAGGTTDVTPENFRIMCNAASWYCLTEGMFWGSSYDGYPIATTYHYHADPMGGFDKGDMMSVSMATSFIGWLSDQYGFDRVSAFCFDQMDFEEAFGTDYDTAYNNWSAWILETCGKTDE